MNAPNTAAAQVEGLLVRARAIGDAIKELGEVPSGELYARVMGHMSLNAYQLIIETMQRAGLIKVAGSHMITWIGPR